MKKFTDEIEAIKKLCRTKKKFFFMFDFDGTISPVVAHPMKAKIIPEWRPFLRRLSAHPSVRTAIVTGREYRDIKKRLGKMPGMYISSNHGYEVWKDGERIFITGTQFRKTFLNLGHDALSTVGGVRGVVIEVKKYSVALHYRMVAAPRQKDVTKRFLQVVKSYSREFSLEVMRGKKLIEVRPKGFWDKGRAVRWMSEKIFPEGLIFYFGDDTTDEDAFAAIGKKGVSVYIGGVKKSRARYRVFRIDQVLPLIEWIQREF